MSSTAVSADAARSAMSSPSVRVNTFVNENDEMYIDPISKIFIISEAVFGYFRLPLIRNRELIFHVFAVFYALFLNGSIFFLTFERNVTYTVITIIHMFQYSFCCFYDIVCVKRLRGFYITLNTFDQNVGCRPKASRHCIQNLVQSVVTTILYGLLFVIPKQLGITDKLSEQYMIIHVAYTIEVNYFCHLLNLLVPRLKLINYYIESSLSNFNLESGSVMENFVSLRRSANTDPSHYRMKMLMDLYHTIVEAYDFLIDAIKWQLLVSIVASFLSILGFLFMFSLNVIKGQQDIIEGVLIELTLSTLIVMPLFTLCTFGDKVHHEVKRLRELLASRLYENKLDKSGRSVARALLAFTETRDLSFRLLRMLNIDISLPFKFVGLLVTYLIILLQFEKVIYPDPEPDAPN